MLKLFVPKPPFLSQVLLTLGSLKNIVPQTLSETSFDFVSFLAGAQGAGTGAKSGIGQDGLVRDRRQVVDQGLLDGKT